MMNKLKNWFKKCHQIWLYQEIFEMIQLNEKLVLLVTKPKGKTDFASNKTQYIFKISTLGSEMNFNFNKVVTD